MKNRAGMEPVITAVHDTQGGKIFQITINRPKVHNCVNGQTARLLLEAWRRFESDESLTVAIFTAPGSMPSAPERT